MAWHFLDVKSTTRWISPHRKPIPHPHPPGLNDERVLSFPPCRLVFAEEVLLGGAGPRSSFGRDPQGRARAARYCLGVVVEFFGGFFGEVRRGYWYWHFFFGRSQNYNYTLHLVEKWDSAKLADIGKCLVNGWQPHVATIVQYKV